MAGEASMLAALTTPDQIKAEIKELDVEIERLQLRLMDALFKRNTLELAMMAYKMRDLTKAIVNTASAEVEAK